MFYLKDARKVDRCAFKNLLLGVIILSILVVCKRTCMSEQNANAVLSNFNCE